MIQLQTQRRGRHLAYQEGPVQEFEADYVVVGSGAGGAAAGATLARAGFEVLLAERGPWRRPEDYPETTLGAARDLWADWGQLTTRGNSIIPILQASVMGGCTTINSAIIVRTPGDVLREWASLGLGEVFTEEAMGTAQDRLDHDLSVAASSGPAMGPNNNIFLESLKARNREAHPTQRAAHACVGSGQCLQGCRNKAKQSTNVTLVPEMMQRGATILSCAPVQKVWLEKGKAVGIKGRFRHPRSRRFGASFKVRARRGVLIAASATGTAPLLQQSGIKLPYLGEGFRGHPGAGIVGVYPSAIKMLEGTPQGSASIHFRQSPGMKLESLALPLEVIASRVGGFGTPLVEGLEAYQRMACWCAAIRAKAVGSVRRGFTGEPVVRYSPTKEDLETLRAGLLELAQMHFEGGAEAVLPGVHGLPAKLGPADLHHLENAPLSNKSWTWVLTHLFGGAVMGADPARSVVGPHLHVWGVERLHVVDASALPTTLGVNPQHTIMAVAMVVAERLANEEKKS